MPLVVAGGSSCMIDQPPTPQSNPQRVLKFHTFTVRFSGQSKSEVLCNVDAL